MIGQNKHNVVSIYRGSGEGTRPTEEQVKRLLELGISLETRTRTGREIAEASISSLTDIEMTDREDVALTALVEKTKEGGSYNASNFNEKIIRSWCSFWTSDKKMEPKNGSIHLYFS